MANNNAKPQFSGEKTIATLKEVSTLIMGQSPSSDSYNADSNGLPFYQGNADFGEDNPTPRIWCTDPKKIAEKGDILISVRAPIGAINIASEQCCIGRGIAAIRPNTELVSRDYLRHQLRASRDKLEAMGTGSTFKAIGKKALGDFAITIYPKKGQEAIACQFNWVAEHIKLANSQLAQLDNFVKSRFIEMFGDITEQYLLGERLETTSGGTPSRKHPEYYEGGSIPWLTSGEVNKGKIDTPDHFITEAGLRNSSAKLVPANSVVVAMYGATAGQVGLVTYETTTNQAVCCIKPNACVAPVFLRYALEFKKDWMIDQCAGGAQPNISQGIVKKVAIPDVTLTRQQEFAAFVQQVDKLRFMLLGNPSPTYRSRSFCCSTNSDNGGVILGAKDY